MKYSKRSLKTGFFAIALMGLLLSQYQNCSSYSDPSPFELPSSTLDTSIGTQKMGLSLASANPVGDMVVVMGTCSAGVYKSYSLSFQVLDGINLINSYDVPCDHGRFHFLIPFGSVCAASLGAQKTLLLKGTMKITDSGTTVKPLSLNASFSVCPF